MPERDWTQVEAGIFHAFYVTWVPEIGKALYDGALNALEKAVRALQSHH